MDKKLKTQNPVLLWLTVIGACAVFFYGIDLLVMAMQGLPLNWDLTPVK